MLHVVAVVLAVELVRSVLKLMFVLEKQSEKKKEVPMLLADKDLVGKVPVLLCLLQNRITARIIGICPHACVLKQLFD